MHAFGRGVALCLARQARLSVWYLRFGADQSYYQQIINRVTSNLAEDAELVGWAMCQGKMGPAVKQRYEAMLEQDPDNARAKLLLDNWVAAKDHPTKEDLDNMVAAAKKAVLGE